MNYFNRKGFLAYLAYQFPAPFASPWTRTTVKNIVDLAVNRHHHSMNQICYFLADLLDEVEFGEVAAFVHESLLTQNGMAKRDDTCKSLGLVVKKNGDVFVEGKQISSGLDDDD